ncbi:MAG: APC family permease [Bryobacteraceae bacterium]
MAQHDSRLVFVRKASGLVKALTWWDVFVAVVSAPAGSGIIYYSVSTSATFPGGNIALSFLIGMLLVFPVIYVAASTSGLIPRSGSLYVLISRVLSPSLGFLAAVLFFLGYTLSVGVVAFVTTSIAGGIFVQTGKAGGLRYLQDFGVALERPGNSAIGGAILVILTWLLVLRGVRAFRRAMRVMFVFAVAAVVTTVGFFFAVRFFGGVPRFFNGVWGAGSYEKVLGIAAQHGWKAPPFSWGATLDLLLVVLFSYGGLELISYASGEVSHSDRRSFRGYIAGWVCLACLYIIISFSVTFAFGDFINAYGFMFQQYSQELGQAVPAVAPSIPFYFTSIMPNPWVSILVSLALCVWLLNTMVPYFFSPSRLVFALAMDRTVPRALTNVNAKTGAPTTASHLTLVVALAGVLLNLLNVGVVLGTILFCALFVYWLYGLSAMLLPYRRPDLYERLPEQRTIGGLPVISIIGLLAFAVGWFVVFVAIRQLSMTIVVFLSVLMGLCMSLYAWRLSASHKIGIDVERICRELPPE